MNEQPVQILLLGSPLILVNGEPLQIQRRTVRSTLFFLACQGQHTGRSDLLVLFWPDEPETKARANLRDMISKLRSQLPVEGAVLSQGDFVALNPEKVFVDVVEFRRLAASVLQACERTPYYQPLDADVVQQMEQAVGLWRSDRFLAGSSLPSTWEFEQWAILTTNELESLRLTLLERLARHFFLANAPEVSIRYLRAALETDEFNFDLHAMMLACLDKLGRTGEAANYCRYLRSLLENNAYEEMPPSLKEYCDKHHASTQPLSKPRFEWPVSMPIRTPYVGRQALLNQLKLLYQANQVICITGEAGIGKTRLLYEFFQRMESIPRLFVLQSNPNETDLPLMPLGEALRRSVNQDTWMEFDSYWAAQLCSLVPELEDWRPELRSVEMKGAENRFLIFEAARQLLLTSAEREICIVLEDAHWAEVDTLAFLDYLGEKGFFNNGHHLMLARREDVHHPALENFLRSAPFYGAYTSLEIPPLTRPEISDLANYLLGSNIGETVSAQLAQETGGNPLFLIEILKALSVRSFNEQDFAEQLRETPIPGSMRMLIRDRLATLQMAEQQILVTAALIGSSFEPGLLEAATGQSPEQVTSALELLERHYVIQSDPQYPVPGAYKFVHEKIRELIIQDLSAARRRLIHLHIAQAMERQGQVGINRSAALAVHFEAGGAAQRAFHYWLQAANYARRLYSQHSAYSAYTRADHLMRQQEHLFTDEEVLSLYAAWGEMAYDLEDKETVATAYHTLERIGQERGSRLLVGSALSGKAVENLLHHRMPEGLIYLERALALLESSEHVLEKTKALLRQGILLVHSYRYAEAAESLNKAIQLAQTSTHSDLKTVRLNVETWLSILFLQTGWPALALPHAQTALKESLNKYFPLIALRSRSVLAQIYYYLGDYQSAYREAMNGIHQAETAQIHHAAGWLYAVAGRVRFASGCLDECWKFAQKALEIGREWNYSDVLSEANCLLGDIYRIAGDLDQACRYYGMGVKTGTDHTLTLNSMARLGMARLESGSVEIGQETLEKAINLARENGLGAIYLMARVARFVYLAHSGQVAPVEETELEQMEQEAKDRQLATLPMTVQMLRARLAFNRGQLDEVKQQLASFLTSEDQCENFWVRFLAQRVLYQCLPEEDADHRKARDLLQKSLEMIRQNSTESVLQSVVRQFEKSLFKK